MCDVLLSEADQAALRHLQAMEPVPGQALPDPRAFDELARLIPCDAMGAVLRDPAGWVVEEVERPLRHGPKLGGWGYGVPVELGLVHWTRVPGCADLLSATGLIDGLTLGVRNGNDGLAAVWLGRCRQRFSTRDRTLLSMIAPTIQRLVGELRSATLTPALTAAERRTLGLVALGFTNAEIAGRMGVATSTVRKHLEHAYRKLGVTNRLAAAAALQGRSIPVHARRERVGAALKDSPEGEWPDWTAGPTKDGQPTSVGDP